MDGTCCTSPITDGLEELVEWQPRTLQGRQKIKWKDDIQVHEHHMDQTGKEHNVRKTYDQEEWHWMDTT